MIGSLNVESWANPRDVRMSYNEWPRVKIW